MYGDMIDAVPGPAAAAASHLPISRIAINHFSAPRGLGILDQQENATSRLHARHRFTSQQQYPQETRTDMRGGPVRPA